MQTSALYQRSVNFSAKGQTVNILVNIYIVFVACKLIFFNPLKI